MNNVCRYKFLVIDDIDLLEIHNLERKVNQAEKHPEPVVKLDAPWDVDKSDSFNYINVIYDHEEQLFKMWYVVTGIRPGEYWERGRKTAYATSTDGIHWEKPILNLVEINGSKENNYIFPEMLSLNYNIIDDPSDIPARRYKMIFDVESREDRWAGYHVPLCLAYSHDGIRWERPKHVNPVLRGVSDDLWGLIYDRDRRKYLLFTRRVPNVPRDISLYESYDLIDWEDRGRVLVPDENDPPEMYNLHGLAPFFYEDFCLGMLGTMYFLPGAELHSVYYPPPENLSFKEIGVLDVQLAYSRDGREWSRPADRSPVVPAGKEGDPDRIIFPSRNGPIVLNGDTWIYYNANSYLHTSWSQEAYLAQSSGDARGSSNCFLAKMPEDHWVSLDAGSSEGFFVAKPWGPPQEILLNADAGGGSVEVELITPYGEPIPNFTRSDCVPIMSNGKDQEVKWKSDRSPLEFREEYRGGVLAKFYLKNAKLYSYTFTLPDPDGRLERDRQNARWSEHITHRSDVPGRASTEAVDGIPPVWKTQTKYYRNVAKAPRPNSPSWEAGFLAVEEGQRGEDEEA